MSRLSDDAEKHMREFSVLDPSLFPEPLGAELFSEPEEFMRGRASSAYTTYSNVRTDQQYGRLLLYINNDPRVNAHAFLGGSDSLITINGGTCVRLRQLFQFVVLDRDTFPEEPGEVVILDAEAAKFGVDSHSLLEPADLAPRAGQPSVDDYIHLFAPLPNTLRRRELAEALYYAALDYLVMHEVAHIARQHADYFDRGRAIHFSETQEDKCCSPSEQPSLIHKIEADADLTACILSAPSLCVGSAAMEFWRGWAKDSAQALGFWLFAVGMTLSLFDGWSNGPDRRARYPHPAVRLALILMQAAWTVSNESDIDQSRMVEILREAHFRALMAWARLGLPSDIAMDRGRPFLDWESWSPQATELYNEVRDTMYPADELRPGDPQPS